MNPIRAFQRDMLDGNRLSRWQRVLFVPLCLAAIAWVIVDDLRTLRRK